MTITDTPDPVVAPFTYDYTLNVDNMGTDVAIGTVVTADIPAGLTLNSTSFPGGGTCLPDSGAGPLTTTCTLGDLDVLTAMQIMLDVTAAAPGSKTLTASATNDVSVSRCGRLQQHEHYGNHVGGLKHFYRQ